MTIGEKIKYFRTKRGITQGKLAELSGIHHVAIRKYETNVNEPQPAQIAKIAHALGVNTIALTGTEALKFDTTGNVMSAMLLLYNAGFIDVTWDKLGNGHPDVSSAKITLNPVFASFLTVGHQGNDTTTDLNDLFLKFSKPTLFGDFISYCGRSKMIQEDEARGCTAENDDITASFIEMQEAAENWLQSDNESLEVALRDNLELHDKEKEAIIAAGKAESK